MTELTPLGRKTSGGEKKEKKLFDRWVERGQVQENTMIRRKGNWGKNHQGNFTDVAGELLDDVYSNHTKK